MGRCSREVPPVFFAFYMCAYLCLINHTRLWQRTNTNFIWKAMWAAGTLMLTMWTIFWARTPTRRWRCWLTVQADNSTRHWVSLLLSSGMAMSMRTLWAWTRVLPPSLRWVPSTSPWTSLPCILCTNVRFHFLSMAISMPRAWASSLKVSAKPRRIWKRWTQMWLRCMPHAARKSQRLCLTSWRWAAGSPHKRHWIGAL